MSLKNKNAISLIVLVITIIILSILAATVIISLSNTNIISEANNAVKKTEAQQVEEVKSLMYVDGMLGNSPESQIIGDTILTWVESDQKVTAVNTKNVDKDGVTIPAGFGYVEGTKDSGLVIEDKDGNQFVWIPVDDYSKFVRGTAVETSEGSGIYKMTGALASKYIEPYTENNWEVLEYTAMCESVKEYGGFYIARFEAGDGDATNGENGVTQGVRTGVTVAHSVVSKKSAITYNYVAWGDSMTNKELYTYEGTELENVAGAVYLSQNMYKDSMSVVSTLCYGVQWDAMMNFVSDIDHNIYLSNSWGAYVEDIEEFAELISTESFVFTTGSNEQWKAKNIYDLASNVKEWTMESYSFRGKEGRCIRGNSILTYSASAVERSNVDYGTVWEASEYGFRVALYLK